MSQACWSVARDTYNGTCGLDEWQIDLHEG